MCVSGQKGLIWVRTKVICLCQYGQGKCDKVSRQKGFVCVNANGSCMCRGKRDLFVLR